MLLQKIKKDKILSSFINKECEENNIQVILDEKIIQEKKIIIKVDKYYNSLNIAKRPKSPDCFIIQKCKKSEYAITIVELKKRRRLSDLPPIDDIIHKFKTCLNDFMLIKFQSYFDRDYKRIDLFFVINKKIYPNNIDISLSIESILEEKIKFKNKYCIIKPCPNNQIIKPCY